jgi:hypothetical protein
LHLQRTQKTLAKKGVECDDLSKRYILTLQQNIMLFHSFNNLIYSNNVRRIN